MKLKVLRDTSKDSLIKKIDKAQENLWVSIGELQWTNNYYFQVLEK